MRVISVESADDFIDYRPEEPGHGLHAASAARARHCRRALGGAIALSSRDIGPNLKAAAERDRVLFNVL